MTEPVVERSAAIAAGRPGALGRLLRFRIAVEGLPFILPSLLVTLFTAWFAPAWFWLAPLLLTFAVTAFFRDPYRLPPPDPAAIVAPADGKILQIEAGAEQTRIAIFLSVFDVHVNRAPVDGTATSVDYRPGLFLAAWDARCTAENEQTRLEFSTPHGPVRVTQIAGLIARRIVTRTRSGDRTLRGERIGLIRFGSRTELVLPAGAEIHCKIGDYVWGGESVLARWSTPEPA